MTLHHLERGDGPRTVVLIHGFMGQGRNLLELARAWLARDPELRIVLPDLAGHGRSPPLPPGAGLDDLADGVLELAGEASALVGHSLGGRVALACARRVAVAKVVLLDMTPGVIGEDSIAAEVLAALRAAPATGPSSESMIDRLVEDGLSERIARWLGMNLERRDDGVVWRIDREALAALHARANAEDLWDAAERLGSRLSCVRSGVSGVVPAADVERLRGIGAEVHTLAGVGHWLHVEAVDALVDWLVGRG